MEEKRESKGKKWKEVKGRGRFASLDFGDACPCYWVQLYLLTNSTCVWSVVVRGRGIKETAHTATYSLIPFGAFDASIRSGPLSDIYIISPLVSRTTHASRVQRANGMWASAHGELRAASCRIRCNARHSDQSDRQLRCGGRRVVSTGPTANYSRGPARCLVVPGDERRLGIAAGHCAEPPVPPGAHRALVICRHRTVSQQSSLRPSISISSVDNFSRTLYVAARHDADRRRRDVQPRHPGLSSTA